MLCLQCDLAIRNYIQQLKEVYSRFSGRGKLPGEVATMSFAEYMEMLDECKLYAARVSTGTL